MTAETVAELLGAQPLADIPTARPEPMLLERLDPEGHTILFGDGGTGKGVIASQWANELALNGETVLILDFEDHGTEWSRRVHSLGGNTTHPAIHHVSPLASTWPAATRGPIWGQKADIRDLADELGVTYLVIDSIAVACGASDVLSAESPAQYAGALTYIGRPALSLAHVTKAGDMRYPFGSAFWHHLSRTTWSVAKAGGEGHRVILQHRKHNNYQGLGKFLVTVDWWEGLPIAVAENGYTRVLSEEIRDVLGALSMTVAAIVEALNEDRDDDEPQVKADSIRKALQRGIRTTPALFASSGTGKSMEWANA